MVALAVGDNLSILVVASRRPVWSGGYLEAIWRFLVAVMVQAVAWLLQVVVQVVALLVCEECFSAIFSSTIYTLPY